MAGKLKDIPFGSQIPTVEGDENMALLDFGDGNVIPIFINSNNQNEILNIEPRDEPINTTTMGVTVSHAETACWANSAEVARLASTATSAGQAGCVNVASFADEAGYAASATRALTAYFAFSAQDASSAKKASEACNACWAQTAGYAAEAGEASWADVACTAICACFACEACTADSAIVATIACQTTALAVDLTYLEDIKYDNINHNIQKKVATLKTDGGYVASWSIVDGGNAVPHSN